MEFDITNNSNSKNITRMDAVKGHYLISVCTLNLLSTLQSPPHSWKYCATKEHNQLVGASRSLFPVIKDFL